MSGVKLHVAEPFATSRQRVLDAMDQARNDEPPGEYHIVFQSWAALAKAMTPKRLEILRHLHQNPETSIATLARSLKRDYKRVHEDVEALSNAGLVDRTDTGLVMEYDEILASIAFGGGRSSPAHGPGTGDKIMDKEATIIDAIRRRRMLHLDYHGTPRTVMPHILGYAGTGQLSLSAYQVAGTGSGWRMFHLDETGAIDITDKGFSRPRHDYNPDDPAFDEVIARL